MLKKSFAILSVLTLACGVAWGQSAASTSRPILSGPLAKLDIKDARIEAGRGAPKGTLPEGEAVHHYWDTVNAPFPWPWEVWEVKG
jgi:hypothetical protein